MYAVFLVLLHIAHFLYSVCLYIQERYASILSAAERRGYLTRHYSSYSTTPSDYLLEVSKVPKNLAILVGQNEISNIDLVKIISWCVFAEIPYLTFYDHKGILQKNKSLIKKELEHLEPQIAQQVQWLDYQSNFNFYSKIVKDSNKSESEVKIHSTKIMQADTIDVTNKFKTKIQVLSYADGKDKIIALTKRLSEPALLHLLQENDITPELLDEKLSLNKNIPNPDLAIIFGKIMCNYGFLPWQSRTTEFFLIPTHQDVSFKSFVNTLMDFGECQQRYGK